MTYILAIDQGTTSVPGDPVRRTAAGRGHRPGGVPPALPRHRLGRTRPRGPVVHRRRHRPRRAIEKAGVDGRRHRRHRHHQPARNHAGLGPRDRQARSTTPSSGRTAAPPTSAPRLKEAGHERDDHRSAPACCSTPTSRAPRSPMAARQRRRRPRAGRARRACSSARSTPT